jgi:hypothetical protein
MKKIVVQIETSKTKADKIELPQELKEALKIPTDNHLVSEGILKATGLNEIFKNGKDNIEGYIKKKGGILPDSGVEFMRWLATAHPELRDTPCKNIRLKREYFIEFSQHIENVLESPHTTADQSKHPIDHKFTTTDAFEVFKYLVDEYKSDNFNKWSCIYNLMKDTGLETHLSARKYLLWIKKEYQPEMRSSNLQEVTNSEYEKLNLIYKLYLKQGE